MALTLYANLISQPSRAVAWVLKVKGVQYEFVEMNPGSAFFKSDEFKAVNPNRLVPAIKDGDFLLTEGMAILQYLGDKYDWTGQKDLYPNDVTVRAKINEFLHWHHTNTRLFTLNIFRPEIAKKLNTATPKDLAALEEKDALIAKEFALLETFLASDFIALTDFPTIADFAAYCEIDQLELMGFEFSKYPKVSAWIARMKAIAFHDEVHQQLAGFVEKLDLRSYQP
ncbi:Glutathione S-transferase theta-1 [Phytophthora pseudosyringae]|uniref:Glutathione S-transferase theta-1 n=1 Tax=Phytophthora pseudosyringae TaxID=221518 RepID=A0A8T1WF41_9STRA|nr:Glutathione S-transferase theta-1 [Phytophthora pseudosyringae]